MSWDPGPPKKIQRIFDQAPLGKFQNTEFRTEWGPMYYRGRLDGSAKILIIGQDPSANENIVRRILIGAAGQLVQGLLRKIGITRSYVMVNSSLYSFLGQSISRNKEDVIFSQEVTEWRNKLLDTLATKNIQAVLCFGKVAQRVVEEWPKAAKFVKEDRVFNMMHPTARSGVPDNWNGFLDKISSKVTKDQDGVVDLTPYGSDFSENDFTPIPQIDLGFGSPSWMGAGSFARRGKKREQITVTALSDSG